MTRMLRRRFIFIAMLSFALLLLLLSVSVVTVNYFTMEQAADEVLGFVLAEQTPEILPPTTEMDAPVYRFDPNAAWTLRHFLVIFADDGTITELNRDADHVISEKDAADMAVKVRASGIPSGHIGSYKYRLTENGEKVAFVDVTLQTQMLLSTLSTLAVVSVIGLALMLVIVLLCRAGLCDPLWRTSKSSSNSSPMQGMKSKRPSPSFKPMPTPWRSIRGKTSG